MPSFDDPIIIDCGDGVTLEKKKIFTLEELEAIRQEVFDRWNWETGSDEDAEELAKLDERIANFKKPRKLHASWTIEPLEGETFFGEEVENELAEAMAKEITDEIDKEIIKGLKYGTMTQEELEEKRQDRFDKWTWETNSKEDRDAFNELDEEFMKRLNKKND